MLLPSVTVLLSAAEPERWKLFGAVSRDRTQLESGANDDDAASDAVLATLILTLPGVRGEPAGEDCRSPPSSESSLPSMGIR